MSGTIVTRPPRTWEVTFDSFSTVASGEVFIIGAWLLDNPISFHNMIHVIFCSTQLLSRRLALATRWARLVMYNLDRQSKAWLMPYSTFVYVFKDRINHIRTARWSFKVLVHSRRVSGFICT